MSERLTGDILCTALLVMLRHWCFTLSPVEPLETVKQQINLICFML